MISLLAYDTTSIHTLASHWVYCSGLLVKVSNIQTPEFRSKWRCLCLWSPSNPTKAPPHLLRSLQSYQDPSTPTEVSPILPRPLHTYWGPSTPTGPSLVPRPSPAPFSWPHTWPLNRPEKWEKAWYIFYVIKPQGELNHDVCGLSFSNYGNVPTRYCTFLWVLPWTNGSGFLVSYCCLLWYRGGPPEASGTDPLVVLLL